MINILSEESKNIFWSNYNKDVIKWLNKLEAMENWIPRDRNEAEIVSYINEIYNSLSQTAFSKIEESDIREFISCTTHLRLKDFIMALAIIDRNRHPMSDSHYVREAIYYSYKELNQCHPEVKLFHERLSSVMNVNTISKMFDE